MGYANLLLCFKSYYLKENTNEPRLYVTFACGCARVNVGYRVDSSNWYNFFIYESIEIEQTLNVKWSKSQRVSENCIQISSAVFEISVYKILKLNI